MAMKRTTPETLLNRKYAIAAGLYSAALGLLAAAGLIVLLAIDRDAGPAAFAGRLALLLLEALVIPAGIQLARGRTWGQQFLLVYHLAMVILALVGLLSAVLWGAPEWWESNVPLWAVGGGMLVLGGVAVVLLTASAGAGGRLRYGAYVAVSVAVAVALVVLVNMIAQKDYVRRNVEMLGRYGLSDRTRRVLAGIDAPVRLTCVYTATDELTDSRYRPRTMEYLNELREQMRRSNRDAEVVNASTDAEKARVVRRLREQVGARSAEHVALLEGFLDRSDALADALEAARARRQAAGASDFLAQWGVSAELDATLADRLETLRDTAQDVREELRGQGLPDYAGLAETVTEYLETTRDELTRARTRLDQIAAVPEAIRTHRDQADKALSGAAQSIATLTAAVGKPDGELPEDASGALKAFVKAADAAAKRFRETADTLDGVAGEDRADLLESSNAWLMRVDQGMFVGVVPLTELYRSLAAQIGEYRDAAQRTLEVTTPEHQRNVLAQLRQATQQLVTMSERINRRVSDALATLSTPDAAARRLLEGAGELFTGVIAPADGLLADAEKLPELTTGDFAAKLTGDNVVIVEVLGAEEHKAEVVPFEDVWPLKMPGLTQMDPEAVERRVFAGDSAIGSELLAMTQPPSAEVVVTYFEPEVPPQMRQMTPPALIPVDQVQTLRERLEEANFTVSEWNLADEEAEAPAGEDQVLLILPPPPAMPTPPYGNQPQTPSFGPEHAEQIYARIDAGAGAIFLVSYMPPQRTSFFAPPAPATYAFGDYLRETWGVDPQIGYRVIPALVDDTQPNRYRIDPIRFSYYALSAFTDHPIGEPLQGQRMIWTDLCPIERYAGADGELPAGIDDDSVAALLRVPEWAEAVWATSDLERLISQVYGEREGFVSPGPADLLPPFNVAVTSVRRETDDVPAGRIVVLGTGLSLRDDYLTRPVPRLGEKGSLSMTDAPEADADVVVNSVYWLVGLEEQIAAGPVRVTPVAMIDPGAMHLLWALCVVALPLAIMGVGGLVVLLRRR